MFDTRNLVQMLDGLFVAFPELAEDENLKNHVLQHGTDLPKVMQACMDEIVETQILTEGIKVKRDELGERQLRLDRREEALRSLILKIMEHAQVQKYTMPEATLSLRKVPPAVIVFNEAEIPDAYMKIKKVPDKTAIKTALLDGQVIDGAMMSNGSITLSIRTK